MNTQIDNNILRDIINEVRTTRTTLANRINTTLIQMHWNIGKRLFEEGLQKGYGNRVVERLSNDLKIEFPNTTGFSPRNLWDMRRLYEFYYQEDEKLRQLVAVLPWKHNILIMSNSESINEARFYVESALYMGWSRDILLNFIKADAYSNASVGIILCANYQLQFPEKQLKEIIIQEMNREI